MPQSSIDGMETEAFVRQLVKGNKEHNSGVVASLLLVTSALLLLVRSYY